jgi:hypothetical protein
MLDGLMSVSEPLVKTVTSNRDLWLKPQDKLWSGQVFEQLETVTILQVYSHILTEIINPILSSPVTELSSKFSEKRDTFKLALVQITNNIIGISKSKGDENPLPKIAELELMIYNSFKKSVSANKSIGSEQKEEIINTVDNLSDYENLILGIMVRKQGEVKHALQQIDVDDMKNKVAEGFLAFYCILDLINTKESIEDKKEKLSILSKIGLDYSQEMVTYADTLDVLSNEDAMKAIKTPD